jgi:hypothetical protein
LTYKNGNVEEFTVKRLAYSFVFESFERELTLHHSYGQGHMEAWMLTSTGIDGGPVEAVDHGVIRYDESVDMNETLNAQRAWTLILGVLGGQE